MDLLKGFKSFESPPGGVRIVDSKGYVRFFHWEACAGDHAVLEQLVKQIQLAQTSYEADE